MEQRVEQGLIPWPPTPLRQTPRQGFHYRKGAGSTSVHAGLTCRWRAVRIIVAHSVPDRWHSETRYLGTYRNGVWIGAESRCCCFDCVPQSTGRDTRGGEARILLT